MDEPSDESLGYFQSSAIRGLDRKDFWGKPGLQFFTCSRALKEFQKAANDAKDADVKAFASKTLPTLQEHLQMSQNINKSLGGKDMDDDAHHAGHTEGGVQNKDKEKDKDGD